MNRFTHFQKGVVLILLLGFVGVLGYMRVLNQSMRSDLKKLQYLDETVLQTPEMLASRQKIEIGRRLLQFMHEDDVEQVKLLFRQGVTTKTLVGGQALSLQAICSGAEKVLAYLLAKGADPNARDADIEKHIKRLADAQCSKLGLCVCKTLAFVCRVRSVPGIRAICVTSVII